MIIFFINSIYTSESFYLEVNPNDTIFEVLKKNGLIDFEYLRKQFDSNSNSHLFTHRFKYKKISSFDDFLEKYEIVKGFNLFISLKNNNIKEYSLLVYDRNPFEVCGGGFIDNIKNEIDLSIGFDMSLIKREELNVNLIHFDRNMTNFENYGYFNNFKVDVVGGFYAIDDINIFRNYLEKIKEKDIPFIVLCSGSAGKDIIPICKQYSFIEEVIIFCLNYSYNEHYINEYPGYVKKVLTSINSVYDYIKTFGEKYKQNIEISNTNEKYKFSDNEISMKSQFLQCPVITAEEYDRCYFLVHRAYSYFFGDMDDKYEKPKFIYQNYNKIIDCIHKLHGETKDLYEQFRGLLNLENNNIFIEKAIREYTKESSFCYLLNKMMRNFESGLISLAYYMGPFLYGLNKYVKENPDFSMLKDMTLYRYINCSKLDFYLYKINKGHIICFPSITSTSSKDKGFCPTSYGNNDSDEKIRIKLIIKYHYEYGNKSPGIKIEDKKGTNGYYLSCFPNENEVILFPFTFMRINDIRGNEIYLEIINRKTYIEYTLKNDVHNKKKFSD